MYEIVRNVEEVNELFKEADKLIKAKDTRGIALKEALTYLFDETKQLEKVKELWKDSLNK